MSIVLKHRNQWALYYELHTYSLRHGKNYYNSEFNIQYKVTANIICTYIYLYIGLCIAGKEPLVKIELASCPMSLWRADRLSNYICAGNTYCISEENWNITNCLWSVFRILSSSIILEILHVCEPLLLSDRRTNDIGVDNKIMLQIPVIKSERSTIFLTQCYIRYQFIKWVWKNILNLPSPFLSGQWVNI